MADKVKPLKIESSSSGGTENNIFPTETDPSEDYLSCKGIAFNGSDSYLFFVNGDGKLTTNGYDFRSDGDIYFSENPNSQRIIQIEQGAGFDEPFTALPSDMVYTGAPSSSYIDIFGPSEGTTRSGHVYVKTKDSTDAEGGGGGLTGPSGNMYVGTGNAASGDSNSSNANSGNTYIFTGNGGSGTGGTAGGVGDIFIQPGIPGFVGDTPGTRGNTYVLGGKNHDSNTDLNGGNVFINGGVNDAQTSLYGDVYFSYTPIYGENSSRVIMGADTPIGAYQFQMHSSNVLYGDLDIQPNTDLYFGDITLFSWGNDDNAFIDGFPMRLRWSNPDTGSGTLNFETENFTPVSLSAGYIYASGFIGTGAYLSSGTVPLSALASASANSVLGRATNSSGARADITAGSDGNVLRRSGTSVGFGSITLNSSNTVTGVLQIANGGTNKALTLAAGAVIWCDSDSFEVTAAGSSGQILRSGGTATPTWSTATFPNTATTTGAYLRADGTNWITSTLVLPNAATSGRIVYASSSNTYGESANLTFNGSALTVAGSYNSETSNSGGSITVLSSNTSNTSGSNAIVQMKVAGSSAGDAKIIWTTSSGSPSDWSAGPDNSDSDSWVLSRSASLGTNNAMRVNSSSLVEFPSGMFSTSRVGIPDNGGIFPSNSHDISMGSVTGGVGVAINVGGTGYYWPFTT